MPPHISSPFSAAGRVHLDFGRLIDVEKSVDATEAISSERRRVVKQ